MQVDVNLILEEYDKLVLELNRKVILLKVENEMLKKEIERKDNDNA